MKKFMKKHLHWMVALGICVLAWWFGLGGYAHFALGWSGIISAVLTIFVTLGVIALLVFGIFTCLISFNVMKNKEDLKVKFVKFIRLLVFGLTGVSLVILVFSIITSVIHTWGYLVVGPIFQFLLFAAFLVVMLIFEGMVKNYVEPVVVVQPVEEKKTAKKTEPAEQKPAQTQKPAEQKPAAKQEPQPQKKTEPKK